MGLGRTRSSLTAVAFGACLLSLSVDAAAQRHPPPKATKDPASSNKSRAAELFKKSADAYLRGDFTQAIALLDEAYALEPEPVLIYNKARAHEGLGHLDEAITLYEKYLAEEPSSADRGAIEQRLVTLRKQRDDRAAVEKDRAAVEKDRAAVQKERATHVEPPPPPPHRRSMLPYVVLGVGGVGLVGGTVFGLLAMSRKDAAVAEPVQQTSIDLRDKGRTFATVSNISFIAGGILVAGGAVLWVVDRPGSRSTGTAPGPLRVGFGPGSVQLGGSFQ